MNTQHDAYQKMQSKSAVKARGRRKTGSAGEWGSIFSVLWRMNLLGILFVLSAAGILFGLQAYYQFSGRIVPGVWIGDQAVSGKTGTEAATLVEETWNSRQVILIDSEDMARTWEIPASALGLQVDSDTSAAQAYAIGHTESPVLNILEIFLSFRNGRLVKPLAVLDEATARDQLTALAAEINIPPVEGEVTAAGDTLAASEGVDGRRVDIESTIILLRADPLSALAYGFFPLVMQPWEPEISDVSAAYAEALALVESGWQVQAYDPVGDEFLVWEPSPQQISAWLVFSASEGEYSAGIDPQAYEQSVRTWAGQVGENRVLDTDQAVKAARDALETGQADTLMITYLPTSWEVGAGETLGSIASQVGIPAWKILEANPSLSGTGLVRASTITIPPADINLELPVVPAKRIVISISEQQMWVYEDQEVVREYVVSTGIAESPTMPGVFQVLNHELNAYGSRWDLYMPHFLGIYEALPGFTNGIHGLPMLSNGQRLWANVLGQPASYGCIILDLEAAEWLYDWAEDGVVVEILR